MDLARAEIRMGMVGAISQLAATLLKAGAGLAYGWYGWTQVLAGNMSLGTYMAFSGYVGYLYGPIGNLIGLLPQFETTRVHARRFFEIYHLEPEIRDDDRRPVIGRVRGHIQFHDVSFGYGETRVLRRISLEICPRSTVAIVGRSGAGKSSLVKLIPRFYDPTAGYIAIDGRDIRETRLHSLRSNIGIALQMGGLFHGTILENITLGRTRSRDAVEGAAIAADIHDFVSTLSEGYETLLGEQGCNLSEGQKQRIGLARVLLMDVPIMIFDEPTGALDTESEAHVQRSLKTVARERTVVLIAHRLQTIKEADEIVVLDDGEIIEGGDHHSLLSLGGVYARLYERCD